MEGRMTMVKRLGARDWGLGEIPTAHGGATVIRSTVIGLRFSCERRAQSSSSTSTAETSNSGASARCAASRSVAVGKKMRTLASRSSGGGTEVVDEREEKV
jgi:hypothetical protein